jgi:iron complex outermembrane receptor protein
VPDFPEWLFQGGVTVEPTDGVVFNVSARHIDDRFTNFVNNETTKGYTIVNAYLDLGDGFGPGRSSRSRRGSMSITSSTRTIWARSAPR